MIISYPFDALKGDNQTDKDVVIKQVCDVLRLSPVHENSPDMEKICDFVKYILGDFMDTLVDMWYNWDGASASSEDIHELFARVPKEMHRFAFEHGRVLEIACHYRASIVNESDNDAITVDQQFVIHTPFFTITIREDGNDADGWELITDIQV